MRSMKVVGQITLTEEALRVCLGGSSTRLQKSSGVVEFLQSKAFLSRLHVFLSRPLSLLEEMRASKATRMASRHMRTGQKHEIGYS